MPNYINTCDGCMPLGEYEYDDECDGTVHHCVADLYSCGDSVVARYGNEGWEYMSSPMAVSLYAGWPSDYPLAEAFHRFAQKQDSAFNTALDASRAAYAADKARESLGMRATDADFLACYEAHKLAAAAHKAIVSGDERGFNRSMMRTHEDRVRTLKLCL